MRAIGVRDLLAALCLSAALSAPASADPAFTLAGAGAIGEDLVATGAVPGDGYEIAPGFETARRLSLTPPSERMLIDAFGGAVSTSDPFATEGAPINAFAGQRMRFEPGVVGDALGRAKASFLNNGGER